jgi:hypothetical protein
MRKWTLRAPHKSISADLIQRMNSISWDRAALNQVSCTRQRFFDDAFTIIPVNSELVAHAAFYAGAVPVLSRLARVQRRRPLGPLELERTRASLCEMMAYQDDTQGLPDRTRQKQVRVFGLFELVSAGLQSAFAPYNATPHALSVPELADVEEAALPPAKQPLINVLRVLYDFLRATLNGNSRKLELYAARHIPYYQTHVSCHLGMEALYTELVRDNKAIVDQIQEDEMRLFLSLLKRRPDPDYLAFFSVLCVVEDIAQGINQTRIAQMLTADGGQILFQLKFDDSQSELLINRPGQQHDGKWTSLHVFSKRAREGHLKQEYAFLQKQLELFGSLALQRNSHAIECLTKGGYLSFDVCFFAARDDMLPDPLRAIFVRVLVRMFIDIGDNADVLAHVQHSHDWKNLCDDPFAEASQDRTISTSGARMPYFERLAAWLSKFLDENSSVVGDAAERNELIAEVLELVRTLVVFGYYAHPKDIAGLMRPVKDLLSGFNEAKTAGGGLKQGGTERHAARTVSFAAIMPKRRGMEDTRRKAISEEEAWSQGGRYEKVRWAGRRAGHDKGREMAANLVRWSGFSRFFHAAGMLVQSSSSLLLSYPSLAVLPFFTYPSHSPLSYRHPCSTAMVALLLTSSLLRSALSMSSSTFKSLPACSSFSCTLSRCTAPPLAKTLVWLARQTADFRTSTLQPCGGC